MQKIWTMGELLVEIMRPRPDMPLEAPGEFVGPFPSGAPAIFCDTVARLGFPAGIIGRVGDDPFGRCVCDRLEKDGVDLRFVTKEQKGSTACAFVTYAGDGSRAFLFHLTETPAARAVTPAALAEEPASFFHVMGCSLTAGDALAAHILQAAEALRANGARISFDPNIRPELLQGGNLGQIVEPILAMCDVLLPGVEELLLLTGQSSLESAISFLFDRTPVSLLALKRGKAGCEIISRTERFQMGVYAVDAVDPTGAGDCFDAAFLCGLLQELPLAQCARMASAAAALNTQRLGPMEGDISMETVERMMRSHPEI